MLLLTWVGFPPFYDNIPKVVSQKSHSARFVFMQLGIVIAFGWAPAMWLLLADLDPGLIKPLRPKQLANDKHPCLAMTDIT